MSEAIRRFSKPILHLIRRNDSRQYLLNGCRSLYTESALELDDYKQARKTLSLVDPQKPDVFRKKMRNHLKNEKNLVNERELKKMLHIIEKNEEDMDLLKTMLERYNDQTDKQGTYNFGPVIMRSLHYLNEPLIALEAVNDPKFKALYDQPTAYAILVDLLYENGMYKEIMDIYDKLRPRSVSKLVVTVVAMACYKENSPESLEFGLKIWGDLIEKSEPLRRTIVTLAVLALNQNKPEIALQLINHCRKIHSISTRSAKVIAHCHLNQMNEILKDFQHALRFKGFYLVDVAHKFRDTMDRLNTRSDTQVRSIFHALEIRQHFQPETLDEYLSSPIELPKKTGQISPEEDTDPLKKRKFSHWQKNWLNLSREH